MILTRGSFDPLLSYPVDTKGISQALQPIPKSMWERQKWNTKSQSLADDGYGSSDGTPKKWGFECEKRLNARGSRDTGEALRPVSRAATTIATLIQLIMTVHSDWQGATFGSRLEFGNHIEGPVASIVHRTSVPDRQEDTEQMLCGVQCACSDMSPTSPALSPPRSHPSTSSSSRSSANAASTSAHTESTAL